MTRTTGQRPQWRSIHEESVLGAVKQFGYDRSRFHSDQQDLDRAIASLAKAIDNSYRDASHGINVELGGGIAAVRIRTPFERPYIAVQGRYDVEVSYLDEANRASKLALSINGRQRGASWTASDDDDAWKSRTISGVDINPGDELMVEVEREGGERGRLDYLQLNYVGTSSATANPRF